MGAKVAGFVMSALAIGVLPGKVAGQTSRPQVRVLLLNDNVVPTDLVERARGEVARLYALINIDVVWVTEGAGPDRPVPGSVVYVIKLTTWEPREDEYPSALGMTPAQIDERGRRAYVFWRRVQRYAQKYAAGFEALLAAAMAHELGHLLVPEGGHSKRGLMYHSWDSEHFRSAAAGLLQFSPDSAKRFHRNLNIQSARAEKR
jgi:hypothetical protein